MELKTGSWTWTLLLFFFSRFHWACHLISLDFSSKSSRSHQHFEVGTGLNILHELCYLILWTNLCERDLLSTFYKWVTGALMVKQNSSFSSNTKSLEVITPVAVNWKKYLVILANSWRLCGSCASEKLLGTYSLSKSLMFFWVLLPGTPPGCLVMGQERPPYCSSRHRGKVTILKSPEYSS